jgi:hypothetical protein
VTAPATQSVQLHCHHCTHWLGESGEPVIFVGMFKEPRDRAHVEEPRDTYRCGSCRWVNVFRRAATGGGNWRRIELKQA